MSDGKRYDHRTPEEIESELELRQAGHVFQSTEDAQTWNAERKPRPLPKSHWSRRAKRRDRLRTLARNWKRLARRQRADVTFSQSRQVVLMNDVEELKRKNAALQEELDRANRRPMFMP